MSSPDKTMELVYKLGLDELTTFTLAKFDTLHSATIVYTPLDTNCKLPALLHNSSSHCQIQANDKYRNAVPRNVGILYLDSLVACLSKTPN